MNTPIKLSPSTLNFFLDCPLCFWLSFVKKIEPPSMPPPTITTGLDIVIKEYMDRYRPKGIIPPFLEGKVPGKLIEYLPKTLKCEIDGNVLSGRLDECIVLVDGTHAPLDHKSRGFELKEDHEIHEAHKFQMDCYTLLLKKNGHPVNNTGYIAYYYPTFGELHKGIPFQVHVYKLKTNPNHTLKVFKAAIKCLEGAEPKPAKDCEMCEYVRERTKEG
jgi:CRISPR/Cas system-associated exonuclease Cas4 (RecB family)